MYLFVTCLLRLPHIKKTYKNRNKCGICYANSCVALPSARVYLRIKPSSILQHFWLRGGRIPYTGCKEWCKNIYPWLHTLWILSILWMLQMFWCCACSKCYARSKLCACSKLCTHSKHCRNSECCARTERCACFPSTLIWAD